MTDLKRQKQLKRAMESLIIKYDMFYSNRQYKASHFKTDEEYLIVQKNLSTEIEMEEKNIKEVVKDWFRTNFDMLTFLSYDSRFVCYNKMYQRIGKVLIKGTDDANFVNKIQDMFKQDFDIEIIVELFENLPVDIQKKFTS